jgi:hypothetical protein
MMNRAERRRRDRDQGPRGIDRLRQVEASRVVLEGELSAQARDVAAWIRDSTEPVPVRLDALDSAIADLTGNPMYRLVAGRAIGVLRELRAELARPVH